MHSGKCWITDWNGDSHEMTPERLLERIRNDSKSNFNWLTPATEIVRTVSDPEFPEPIANELKCIVLKCFAELLVSDQYGHEKSTDQLAVAYCYNSVHGKAGKRIKRLYRKNLIESVTRRSSELKPYNVCGKEWHTFREEYEKNLLQNFPTRIGSDFMRFRSKVVSDYRRAIEAADKAGRFENDKAEHKRTLGEFTQRMIKVMDLHELNLNP